MVDEIGRTELYYSNSNTMISHCKPQLLSSEARHIRPKLCDSSDLRFAVLPRRQE